MNYEKKTKDELISELKSLKSKLEGLENTKLEGAQNRASTLMTDELKKIFDLSLDMICIADITIGYFKKINPAFEKTLGYSNEELLGKPFTDFVHPDDKNPTINVVEEMLSRGVDVVNFENRYRCKDGSYKWLMWTSKTITEQGVSYAVARDITEKKLVEEELRKHRNQLEELISERTIELTTINKKLQLEITERRKMEKELINTQKLESVSMLAGGIAHDFNNSLQAILGFITLARVNINSKNEVHELLEEAKNAVLQAASLTQQLLTFSKGGEPTKKVISVNELITDSTKLAMSGSNVMCELVMPDNLWQIEADKGQLSQVISNLIINANQAMPEEGSIKIWTVNTNITEKDSLPLQEGNYIKIAIEDCGTGISQEHLQRIFDPYFTTKQNGSGLGLATAYLIVKKHNGHIAVESEIGIGTTFSIFLPAPEKKIPKQSVLRKTEKAPLEPAEEEDEEKPVISKGRILLMDDEYIIRTILSKQLKGLKYEVEAVEEGSEAIRSYEHASRTGKPFDAVIMDLTIAGGMGGKETMKRLLEIDPEAKAIVSSGYANDPVMADHMKYGFKGLLAKPHEIHELDEALHKVMTMTN
ncbi:MAG: PAS domain S-box protein [Candidatus Brocadiales bacterium]|nr:PAS domain S-box protein [Candidatus Brocadiales bacterium]